MLKILQKKSLFWDTESVDPKKNKDFVIKRILQFGDEVDFNWAKKFYGINAIKNQFFAIKNLDKKSLSFWRLYFS